jgi:Lrp/AsnC family leucine-responsive transcriptional regulator
MPHRAQLDDVDHAILDLLCEDARRTTTEIAARVNLTPAPVKRRIDRLERLGVITGYTAVLDHSRVAPSLEAYTELRFTGQTDLEEIISAVVDMPEAVEIATIAGDPDALVRFRVDDVTHLQRAVNQLRRTGHVTGTKTLIVLDRWSRDSPREQAGR